MSVDELYKGLDRLKAGVQEYAILDGTNQALEKVREINMSQTDEIKKRQATQQLGNELALRLSALGASGTQIQTAFEAIRPAPIKDANDAYMQGQLTGSEQLMKLGQKQQSFDTAPTVNENAKNRAFQADEANKDRLFKLAMMNLEGKSKGGEKKAGDISFETNLRMGQNFLNQLEKSVKRSGTWESRFGETEDAANFDGIPYQLAITYAKIVDPDSVAREGEVAAAQKYLIELGPTASRKKVLEQIKHMRETINSYGETRGAVKGETGSPASSAAVPKQEVKTFRLPGGKQIKGIKLPNGKIQEVLD